MRLTNELHSELLKTEREFFVGKDLDENSIAGVVHSHMLTKRLEDMPIENSRDIIQLLITKYNKNHLL